jgi:Zn-dependent protease
VRDQVTAEMGVAGGIDGKSHPVPTEAGPGSFRVGSIRLGSIAGVSIRVHITWVVFALVVIALTVGYMPDDLPDLRPRGYAILGLTLVLLLFGSVLVHELSHAVVAKARGVGVRCVTLFLFGGMCEVEGEFESPDDELYVFLAGPLSSLALAGLFWALASLTVSESAIAMALPYLAIVNLVTAAVNLVPGLPLDGGRVLRAYIWKLTGSARNGTDVASWLGQGFAVALVALGGLQLLGGNYLGTGWDLVAAWFLYGLARGSRQASGERPIPVEALAESTPVRTPPDEEQPALAARSVSLTRADRSLAEGTRVSGPSTSVPRMDIQVAVRRQSGADSR